MTDTKRPRHTDPVKPVLVLKGGPIGKPVERMETVASLRARLKHSGDGHE